ncbi:MAG TPA: lipopolysaccharide biosynthesis protein [Mycobacteriales bacterium]|nr:lipopolysaccharide biosynthesis protein [Mycobacteriales bacterium]
MAVDGAPARAGLGRRVRRGLVFSLLNNAVGRLGTVAAGIVLARLLVPADFGAFAVALVALNAVLSMNEMGASLALVRWPGDPRRIAPTVTTISLVTSALLYAGCLAGAGPFATAMGTPGAAGVVRLLCASVLLDAVTATPAALLTRDFRQGQRLAVDLSSFALSTGLTVALAVGGHGAWSLAWGRLAGNLLSAALLFWLASIWPRPGFDRRQFGELLSFGLPLAGASVLLFGMLNVDYLVVGPLLGPVALGLYLQAFNLSSWPVNMFSTAVRRVSLAGFSRLQDDPGALVSGLARSTALLAAATLPACLLLGLLAHPAVTVVYGQRWAGSASALQFLAVLGFTRVLAELLYDFLVAAGRSRATMVLQGLWLAALLPALLAGTRLDGIRGAALAHALVGLCLVIPAFAVAVARTGVPWRPWLAPLGRPLAGAALLVVAVVAVRSVTTPGFVQLVAGGVAGVAVYLPVVAPMRRLVPGRGGRIAGGDGGAGAGGAVTAA